MGKLALLLIFLVASSAHADWGKNFGGWSGSNVQINGVATDGSGNSYLAGSFDGLTLVVGSTTLNRIGTTDAFAAKLDSTGTVLWAKNYGGSGASTMARSIAVDGSGNVYLGGDLVSASLTSPALTKLGTRDGFAIKLDSAGNTTWAKNFGGLAASVYGQGIAVDGSGNVYLGGYFSAANLTTPALTKIGSHDAFAIKLDSSGNTTWAKNFGGSMVYGQSIAVDGSGSVYLAGNFLLANLTTPVLAKIGFQDAFVIKLDSAGTTTWAKSFGGTGVTAAAYSVAVDSSGIVYLGGYFQSGSLTTPALVPIGNSDAFAFKLDTSGNVTWAKNYGGSGVPCTGQSIAFDGSGNVYLSGKYNGGNLTTPALTIIGIYDAFAIKLDSSGNTTWSKNFGGIGATAYGQIIAVDGSGNVYVGGYFQSASLTTPALSKVGYQDAFTIKLDSSGNTSWSKDLGAFTLPGSAIVRGLARDSGGNIYIAGNFTSLQHIFGAITLNRIGSQDAFVVKMDKSGTVLWAKNYGGAFASTYGRGIAVDATGNVYLGGYFQNANLTTPALTRIGGYDAFVLKIDSSGNTTWSKNYGAGPSNTYGQSIAVDGSGNVYLGGNFTSSWITPALTLIGAYDAFVLKIDSSGNTTWAKNFGGAGARVYGNGIAVDGSGNVYLGGYFENGPLTTPALTLIGSKVAFTIKLDASGNTTWAKNFGGAGANVKAWSIAVDGSGNSYLGGSFYFANMTTPAFTLMGSSDAFAIKLDTNGNIVWSKSFGGAGANTDCFSIAADGSSNVYLGGNFDLGSLTTPALTLIGSVDAYALKLDSSGNTTWAKNYGGAGASAISFGLAVDGNGNVLLGGDFTGANLTAPALSKIGGTDALIIDAQLYNTTCTSTGKFKYDSSNNVMVFCDGSSWQSMNNSTASTCTGTTAGKVQYYSNGASSDFVWYGGSCRSAKGSTTFGACAVNGKIEWDAGNSTLRGCINGTWTSLKGF